MKRHLAPAGIAGTESSTDLRPESPVDLAAFLSDERREVERGLERALASLAPRMDAALLPVVRHGLLSGGKRLRPILCATAYRACGGGPDEVRYDLAVSLEMIHAYSLMHDDLPCMDDADLRRGSPTPHTVFGAARTARAAAALIPAAALQAWHGATALGCTESVAREVVRVLTRAAGAGGMVGGQAVDLLSEETTLSAEELDTLHGLKTGALLAASLRIGSLAAGASVGAREALDRYGRAIGLAFQIADDILDATASAEALGKNPSDEALGKSTYVALHGLERARREAARQVSVAHEALKGAGLDAPALVALASYIVERDR